METSVLMLEKHYSKLTATMAADELASGVACINAVENCDATLKKVLLRR
jgi:hypothetical protein